MTFLFESGSLEKITNGNANKEWKATGISIDTRTIKKGDLFCAIKGTKYDGHDFIKKAYDKGAVAVLVNRNKNIPLNKPCLKVNNVLKALEKIADNKRKGSKAKFIAITGSVGKTGTKEMLRDSFDKVAKVYANEASFNNHIGVPLALCKMPKNIKYSVLELGMNKLGEIKKLSKIVMPEVGIITSIENAHLSGLRTLNKIAEAKCEILSQISNSGCFIFNNDTNFSDYMLAKAKKFNIKNIISYGIKKSSDVRLLKYRRVNNNYIIKANVLGQEVGWKMPVVSEHWVHNSLSVIAVGLFYNLSFKNFLLGLRTFKVPTGRGNKIKCYLNGKKFIIINDSYNSNPASLKSSLAAFSKEKTKGKKIIILGDMLELGQDSLKIHLNFTNNIISSGAKVLITKGRHMKELNKSLPTNIEKYHIEKSDNLIATVYKNISNNDLLLVKGSNSIGLGEVVRKLKNGLN